MAAGHDEKKKAGDALDDLPILSADNLQNNMKIIYYSRTFLSIIGGVIAGILGLTGLTGFICYFLVMAIASLGFVARRTFPSMHTSMDGVKSYLMAFLVG